MMYALCQLLVVVMQSPVFYTSVYILVSVLL